MISSTTFHRNLSKNTSEKTHLGLLTETHEVLLRLIKTPNIHVFKIAAPTEDVPPRPYCRSRRGAMGWVLGLARHKIDKHCCSYMLMIN